MAALSFVAIPSRSLKLSEFCIPLPPDTTISADINSGRSDTVSSFLTNVGLLLFFVGKSCLINSGLPPSVEVLSKEVVLIVRTFLLCSVLTVAIHAPA